MCTMSLEVNQPIMACSKGKGKFHRGFPLWQQQKKRMCHLIVHVTFPPDHILPATWVKKMQPKTTPKVYIIALITAFFTF